MVAGRPLVQARVQPLTWHAAGSSTHKGRVMWNLGFPGTPEPPPDDPEPKPVVIDERWLDEYVRFGFDEMRPYMTRHAAFEDYYRNRKEEQ